MQLQSGIRVRFTDEYLGQRLNINGGSYFETVDEKRKDIFLPLDNWRSCSEQELSHLLESPSAKSDASTTVVSGKVSSECLASLGKVSQALTVRGVRSISRADMMMHFSNELALLFGEIDSYIRIPESIGLEGAQIDKAGEITLAYNESENRFVGLHIDGTYFNRDKLDAIKNVSRFALNIGASSRYFLFINLSLSQMESACGVTDKRLTAGEITEIFLRENPDYPILKLEVPPGHFYYAPVYNVVHDGSSSEMETQDMSIAARGFFN